MGNASSDFKQIFSKEGLANLGGLFGKAASAGLKTGLLIGNAIIGDPIGAIAEVPGAIKSNISLFSGIYDLARTKNIKGDLDETERKILGGSGGDILDGVNKITGIVGDSKAVEKSTEDMSNRMFRGTGVTPVSQIAKIAAPVKNLTRYGDIGRGPRTALNVGNLLEGTQAIRSGTFIPSSAVATTVLRDLPGFAGRFQGLRTPASFTGQSGGIQAPPSITGPLPTFRAGFSR